MCGKFKVKHSTGEFATEEEIVGWSKHRAQQNIQIMSFPFC